MKAKLLMSRFTPPQLQGTDRARTGVYVLVHKDPSDEATPQMGVFKSALVSKLLLGALMAFGAKVASGETGARIRADWQTALLAKVEEKGAKEGWGLFTSGGWSDDGQVMVISTESGLKAYVGAPNVRDVTIKEKAYLNAAEQKAFLAAVKDGDDLSDYTVKQFDGLEHEYVHAVRTDKGVEVKKRIFVNVPDDRPDAAKHNALIAAFAPAKAVKAAPEKTAKPKAKKQEVKK